MQDTAPRRVVTGDGGGAIYNYDSEAVVIDCLFEGNTTNDMGGAIINTAQQSGTGVTATIFQCEFYDNEVSRRAGAIANVFCSPEIKSCLFQDNISHDVGGAIYNRIAEPNITECTFIRNTADENGALPEPGRPQ